MTHDVIDLAEVVGFLVAIMVLATACADAGLFEAIDARLARLGREPGRALAWAVVASAVVTVVLSLDATVVLLTPIVMIASGRRRDHAYATVRLANSGSLLLPVSNLTNLLVFPATGLSFLGFAWAMLPVWLLVIAAEYVVLRRRFGADVTSTPALLDTPAVPLYPAAVVIAVLFALSGGVTPWIPATAGAIVVAGVGLVRGWSEPRKRVSAANLTLAGLVIVWGGFVAFVASTDVGAAIADVLPTGSSPGSVIAIALLAMLAANLVNTLPVGVNVEPISRSSAPSRP